MEIPKEATQARLMASNDPNIANLGGKTPHTPLVLSWAEGRTDVFHIGTNNKLYISSRAGDFTSSFSSWENISGTELSSLSGVCWDKNRIDIFATGAGDNYLKHKCFNGEWHGFDDIIVKDIGGPIVVQGDITTKTFGPDSLFVFFRDMSNWVYCVWWNKTQKCWSKLNVPQEWGFHVSGAPKITAFKQDASYRLDIFVRGMKNEVCHKTLTFTDLARPFDGTWTPAGTAWSTLGGGPVIDDVAVVSALDDKRKWHTHLFSRNQNNQVVRRWLGQGDADWSPSAGWDVSWGVGWSPVQAVVTDSEKITIAMLGDFNVTNIAETDLAGNWLASWMRINVGGPDGVVGFDHPVLHPRGGPRGWLQDRSSIPLEVFLRGTDASIRKILVREEDIDPKKK